MKTIFVVALVALATTVAGCAKKDEASAPTASLIKAEIPKFP